jgi:hypothetical protein
MNQSEQINELASALSKCQSEMLPAAKDSLNPFFKSKYSDLNAIWNACRGPLTRNGLAVVQTMEEIEGKFQLVTTLVHASGQWVKSFFPIIVQKQDAQSYGSACSYARRYSLSSIVGVTTDDGDDDGERAGRAEYITGEMINKLTKQFESCSPDYVRKVWDTLKKDGIENYQKITVPIYDRLMKAAHLNSQKSQSKNEELNVT